MNSPRLLFWCALALSLVPSLAWAGDSSLVTWARARVQSGIIKPLSERQGSRFSRSRPVPRERRARILQATTSRDKGGRDFLPFAIDIRYGEEWREDQTGCVYKGSGELFVKSGEEYFPAAILLGKDVKPVAGVCESAPPPRA